MTTLEEVARLAMDALGELGIGSALCGGLAHNAWVEPAGQFSTADVDLAILVPEGRDLDAEAVVGVLRRLSGEAWWFRDRYRRRDRSIFKFQLGEGARAVCFDLVLAERGYATQAIASAALVTIGGSDGRVLQPEDVVLYKALGRRRKDVERIAAMHERVELDLEYLQAWGRHLGRWDYLREALGTAEGRGMVPP